MEWLQNENVFEIMLSFTLIILAFALQDIAVDGWAIEMLHPDNREQASPCQTFGLRLGMFIGTSIFLALNSDNFAKYYLNMDEPLMTIPSFLYYWAIAQFIITVLIAIFIDENKINRGTEEQEEVQVNSPI